MWDYYCRHPYLPRLAERQVLDKGIAGVADELTWDTEAFAVATGYDDHTGRYLGLAIPHQDTIGQVTDSTLLLRPDLALAQRDQELTERTTAAASSSAPVGDTSAPTAAGGQPSDRPVPAGTGDTAGASPPGARNTRFFGVARISPDRYARDLTRLSQEIIQHLAAPDGVELEIRVEITARKPDADDKVRNVTENARTLKFETYGFEDH